MPIQSQGIITRDNVSIDVSAVAYYRVKDPIRSVVAIENVSAAITRSRRRRCGRRRSAHARRDALRDGDDQPEHPRDPRRPDRGVGREGHGRRAQGHPAPRTMQRAMARQAEAEREKRAKIIAAEGEALAAGELETRRSDDGPPARAAAAQPTDPGRDRGRQELHGHLSGSTDEHNRGARWLPQPRKRGRWGPARVTRPAGRSKRRAPVASTLGSAQSAAAEPDPLRANPA